MPAGLRAQVALSSAPNVFRFALSGGWLDLILVQNIACHAGLFVSTETGITASLFRQTEITDNHHGFRDFQFIRESDISLINGSYNHKVITQHYKDHQVPHQKVKCSPWWDICV